MLRVAIYWVLLSIVMVTAYRRGDPETRLAALICLFATAFTVVLLTPFNNQFSQIEVWVALIDVGVLLTFVGIALRSDRFWPLWVSGLQLTTVLAHILRLIQPGLVDLAYAAAMRFWSYPILLIIVAAAYRTRHFQALQAAAR